MNASLHSRDSCLSHRRNDQSSLNRRRSLRRNYYCVLLLATALFYNNSNIGNILLCEAFIVCPSRRCQTTLRIDFGSHRKQSPFTKRTRTRYSGDASTTRRVSPESNRSETEGDGCDPTGSTPKERDAVANANAGTKWGHNNGNFSVYEDLEKLERAMTLEDAELKLQHSKLKEQIDFQDQSKRLVVPDALRFLVVPLFYAFILYKLSSWNGRLSLIARSITRTMDLHFWIVVVGSPMLLNACKTISRRSTPKDPIPDELNNLDPICATLMLSPEFNYEDPRASCDDTVSFLVEYWTSAVNGVAFLYILKAVATILIQKTTTGRGLGPAFQSSAVMLWLSCTQVLTRLAAVVSLYQYPKKLYELERSDLTRPVGFFPTLMLKLVRSMMVLAPLGLISDFSKVLVNLPKGSIYPLYSSIVVCLFGTWTRMQESVTKNKDPLGPARLQPPKPLTKIFYGLSYMALWRKQLRALGLGSKVDVFGTKLFTSFPSLFWKTVGVGSLVSLSLLGPLIHLKAFSKIFQVEYTNDLPALSTEESYQRAIEERPSRASDMAWRHTIRWRKPQRLKVSKGWIYHDIIYSCLFQGSALERIDDDRTEQIRKRVWSGRTIAERIERELENLPEGVLLNGDSEDWKTRAMDFQARKHESSYSTQTFEDPLGVAIYKAFGIGLGYNFDHMSEPKEGQEPSPRRLQARAAKSALRRYNELNDAEQALIQTTNELDPKDRDDQTLTDTKQEFDDELEYLAGRLQELIPSRSTVEEFGLMDAAKFKMKSEPRYRKVSPTEYRKLEEDPLGFDESSTLGKILNTNENNEDDQETNEDVVENNNETKSSDTDSGDNDDDDENDTAGLLDIEYV